jgi:hypothetical protein
MSHPGSHCLLPGGGRTTPRNQVRLASSTHCLLPKNNSSNDWISLPFARRWKNNSSKSGSTAQFDQFDWPHCLLPVGGRTTPPNQVRLVSSTGQWLSRPTSNGSHYSPAVLPTPSSDLIALEEQLSWFRVRTFGNFASTQRAASRAGQPRNLLRHRSHCEAYNGRGAVPLRALTQQALL